MKVICFSRVTVSIHASTSTASQLHHERVNRDVQAIDKSDYYDHEISLSLRNCVVHLSLIDNNPRVTAGCIWL